MTAPRAPERPRRWRQRSTSVAIGRGIRISKPHDRRDPQDSHRHRPRRPGPEFADRVRRAHDIGNHPPEVRGVGREHVVPQQRTDALRRRLRQAPVTRYGRSATHASDDARHSACRHRRAALRGAGVPQRQRDDGRRKSPALWSGTRRASSAPAATGAPAAAARNRAERRQRHQRVEVTKHGPGEDDRRIRPVGVGCPSSRVRARSGGATTRQSSQVSAISASSPGSLMAAFSQRLLSNEGKKSGRRRRRRQARRAQPVDSRRWSNALAPADQTRVPAGALRRRRAAPRPDAARRNSTFSRRGHPRCRRAAARAAGSADRQRTGPGNGAV